MSARAQVRYANQLEIIRSEEKDRYMISALSKQVDDLYTKLFGLNNFHIYQSYLRRFSELLYYLPTTLLNRQTVGEEYICLIQYNRNRKQVPSLIRRLFMVIFRIFGDLISKYVLSSFIIQPIVDDYFHPKLSKETIELILEFLITFILKTHEIIFYLTGHYYDISKAITRIRYLIYIRSTSDSQSIESKLNRTMKLLSFCLCIQHISECYTLLKEIAQSITRHRNELDNQDEIEQNHIIVEDSTVSSKESVRCPLCYELTKSNVALVSECGHVFCWQCIHTWVIDNQTCPLCKTSTSQSRIVHLVNY